MSATSPILQRIVDSETALHQLAASLAHQLQRGDCLLMHGTLGMGKTSFCRALIRALSSPQTDVSSPTFTLLQSYPITLANGEEAEFWHADLYRLENAHALEELGLHELSPNGILAVEWPAIADGWLPREALEITLAPGEHDDARTVSFASQDAAHWRSRLAALG
jgi:tRNA threonylcarbamoyl adenosine modification protein YjeE